MNDIYFYITYNSKSNEPTCKRNVEPSYFSPKMLNKVYFESYGTNKVEVVYHSVVKEGEVSVYIQKIKNMEKKRLRKIYKEALSKIDALEFDKIS